MGDYLSHNHIFANFTDKSAEQEEYHSNCEEFKFNKEYGYVIMGVIGICFTYVMIGFVFPMRVRMKVFNKEFMDQFDAMHKENYSSDVTKQIGYPDMGSGFYAQKLPYKEWRYFNMAQRVHYQFLENIVPICFFVLFTGLYFPWWAVGLSGGIVFSRISYCFYVSDEGVFNPLRMIGTIGNALVLLIGVTMSVLSAMKMSCWI